MGTVNDFPNRTPDGGDQEFAEALWDSVPANIQKKFDTPEQIDDFLTEVQDALETTGLSVTKISIGIDPDSNEAVLSLSAIFI